jgi:hypothetical protein
MTVKLILLKSGEDIIADVTEMIVGENEDKKVIGMCSKTKRRSRTYREEVCFSGFYVSVDASLS